MVRRQIACLTAALIATFVCGMLWNRSARAGDLNPPPGPITSTGHTLTEIYDKIQAVNDSVGSTGIRLNTDVGSGTLGSGASMTIGNSGTAIIHSILVHTGGCTVHDATGKSLGRMLAQACRDGNGPHYDSTYQVFFNIQAQLPLTVTALAGQGDPPQSCAFDVIYARQP